MSTGAVEMVRTQYIRVCADLPRSKTQNGNPAELTSLQPKLAALEDKIFDRARLPTRDSTLLRLLGINVLGHSALPGILMRPTGSRPLVRSCHLRPPG